MQDAQDGQPDPGPPGSALRHGSNPHLAVSHAQQMPSPSPQHYAYQLYSQPPSASSSMTPALQHGSARAYNPVPYHSQSQGTKGDSSSSLHPPAKTSSGGKTFTCTGYEGCSMSFSRSEHLARHVRKHTGEKPFTCRCGKKFTRLDNLRQHASTIHADEPEANEELFEKLAANMPRSGRTTRRKASQSKAPANPPSVEYAVPPDAASTSPYQEGIPQHALVSQERFLPPPNPSSGAGNRPLAGPTQSSQLPSAMYSLPQPLPSPSFRFPTSMHSTPADYDNRDHLRYDNRPYANQYYPYPSTAPQPHSSSSHAYEQHRPAHTLSHPSHAKDDGRDGSSFRPGHHSTSSPARIEPPLADSSAPGEHPHLSSSWTTATQPTPSAAHRPILPSLSSLIAGTPVTVNGMDPDTALYHHGSRTMSSQRVPQTKLDSTLLAAAEMAMSTSASSAVPSPLASQGSRSSSFSNSSGYASACLTTATSPPPRMSPCTSLQ